MSTNENPAQTTVPTESDMQLSPRESAIFDAANARFLSVPDEKHEFDFLPVIDMIQLRGNWISAHAPAGTAVERERLPSEFRDYRLYLHSERNRLKQLCMLAMQTWLADLPGLLSVLDALETAQRADEPASEDLTWEGEGFGLEVLPDCYRIGPPGKSHAPIFADKDLILDFIIFVAGVLSRLPEDVQPPYDALECARKAVAIRNQVLPAEQ